MIATSSSICCEGKQNGSTIPVIISDHARVRWNGRTPADISLETAWSRSVAVEAPDADSTSSRLYPPHNALMLVKHREMTTVLNNDGRLNTPGLIDCPSCGDLIDPMESDTCPWCGSDYAKTTRPGSITLTRGDL